MGLKGIYRRIVILLVIINLGAACQPEGGPRSQPDSYSPFETSVSEFHDALQKKKITSTELVQYYLKRIEKYDADTSNLSLKSVITLNPSVLQEAQKKDQHFSVKKLKKNPLYGVPILVKDNINTLDVPKRGGHSL